MAATAEQLARMAGIEARVENMALRRELAELKAGTKAKGETETKSGPKTVASVFDDLQGIVDGTVTLAAAGGAK